MSTPRTVTEYHAPKKTNGRNDDHDPDERLAPSWEAVDIENGPRSSFGPLSCREQSVQARESRGQVLN
jgi:hypothetical protein